MQSEIHSAQASNTGRVRTNNEDSVGIFESVSNERSPHNLYLVCDGMGGHQAGEIASQIVVKEVAQAYASHIVQSTPATSLQLAVQHAHEVLCKRASGNTHLLSMGTTAVIASLHPNSLHIANIGDSRAYLLHTGKLEQITTDHSQVKAMVDAGVITEQEAAEHNDRSVLTRSISASRDSVEPDIFQRDFGDGDALLLCSDGVFAVLTDDQIGEVLQQHADLDAVCHALIKGANDGGGPDNVTVVVLEVHAG